MYSIISLEHFHYTSYRMVTLNVTEITISLEGTTNIFFSTTNCLS